MITLPRTGQRKVGSALVVSAGLAAGVSGGGRGLSSYTPPPARPQIEATGSVPHSVAAAHGGTTIIVG
ncbi:MAG: hypothetical protein ACK5E1_37075, partial [Bradyrhizobium sp.]